MISRTVQILSYLSGAGWKTVQEIGMDVFGYNEDEALEYVPPLCQQLLAGRWIQRRGDQFRIIAPENRNRGNYHV